MWCVGRRARTYCRPYSRFSASPASHATLPWLAPQQDTRLRALDLATPAVAVDAQQVRQRSARALVQHGARVPDQAWMASRLVVLVLGGSGVLAKVVRGESRSGRSVRVRKRARVGWVALCACRGVGGDSPGPWPARWHARIAQGRRVGELQPEYFPRFWEACLR